MFSATTTHMLQAKGQKKEDSESNINLLHC